MVRPLPQAQPDPLAAWFPGCLALWPPDPLAAWFPGCLALWRPPGPGPLVGPPARLILWRVGGLPSFLAHWLPDGVRTDPLEAIMRAPWGPGCPRR